MKLLQYTKFTGYVTFLKKYQYQSVNVRELCYHRKQSVINPLLIRCKALFKINLHN
jgi:hypothetical protein